MKVALILTVLLVGSGNVADAGTNNPPAAPTNMRFAKDKDTFYASFVDAAKDYAADARIVVAHSAHTNSGGKLNRQVVADFDALTTIGIGWSPSKRRWGVARPGWIPVHSGDYWVAKVQDNHGAWSGWSEVQQIP